MENNRRDFIKTFSAMAAAGLFVSGMPWLKDLHAQDGLKTVRLGIIGPGSRGMLLLEELKRVPGLEISCFCDNYEPHFERAGQFLPGAKGYRDYRDMLEKEQMDGVVIAVPLHKHKEITVAALDAGLHTFCEKAMAQTYEDCNEMVKARERNNKILYIGHQRIFNTRILQALKEIEDVSTELSTLIKGISDSTKQQSQTAMSVSDSMNVIQEITLQTSEGTEETSTSLTALNKLSGELGRSVSGFKLPSADDADDNIETVILENQA